MTEVSMRELNSNLSEYVRRAEAGEEIGVTRRGKRVAVLAPTANGGTKPKTLEEKLLDLQRRGIISNVGKKFKLRGKPIPLRGEGPSMSEMIIEDRGER